MFWNRFFQKKKKGDLENILDEEEKETYVPETLNSMVGENIEIHYLNQDKEKIRYEKIVHVGKRIFYIGKSPMSKYIMHMDHTDMYGKRDAVKLIKDEEGNVIYDNPDVEFDYDNIKQED